MRRYFVVKERPVPMESGTGFSLVNKREEKADGIAIGFQSVEKDQLILVFF